MKVIRWLDDHFEKTMCILLFVAFAGLMILNVIMRFVFANALPWATELVLFLFAWFVMFAMSYGFKTGAHVRVDIVAGLLSKKPRKILELICISLVLALFLYLFYHSIFLVMSVYRMGHSGLLIAYPKWTLYMALPVGTFCGSIRIIQNLRRAIGEFKALREEG